MSSLSRREKLTLRVEHTAARSADYGTPHAEVYKLLRAAELEYRQQYSIPEGTALADDALRVDHDDDLVIVYWEQRVDPSILRGV